MYNNVATDDVEERDREQQSSEAKMQPSSDGTGAQSPLLYGDEEEGRRSEGSAPIRARMFDFAEPGRPSGGRSKDGSPHATDEVYNASSHLVGSLLSILGLAMLVSKSAVEGKVWQIVTFSIFGGISCALFFASFLHHGLHWPSLDRYFRMADYMCIYLMIAGTATPLCLVFRHDHWSGWTFFGTFWLMAVIGVSSHAILGDHLPKWLSNTLYGVMGFMGLCLAPLVYPYIGVFGLILLASGGAAYIGGNIVFVLEKPNPIPGRFGFHEIWHTFVLAGAAFHWFVMFQYVQPYQAGSPSH